MFWDKQKRKEDSDRYAQLEDNLGYSELGSYNTEAFNLRGKRERKNIKKQSETRPQLVEEESWAIEFSRTNKNGQKVAQESVDKNWWENL